MTGCKLLIYDESSCLARPDGSTVGGPAGAVAPGDRAAVGADC